MCQSTEFSCLTESSDEEKNSDLEKCVALLALFYLLLNKILSENKIIIKLDITNITSQGKFVEGKQIMTFSASSQVT